MFEIEEELYTTYTTPTTDEGEEYVHRDLRGSMDSKDLRDSRDYAGMQFAGRQQDMEEMQEEELESEESGSVGGGMLYGAELAQQRSGIGRGEDEPDDELNWYVPHDNYCGDLDMDSLTTAMNNHKGKIEGYMHHNQGKEVTVKKRKYVLVFSFYPPWVGFSAVNSTKSMARRNRLEARSYMQKKKERAQYYF